MRTDPLIQKWLNESQQLIISLNQLCNLRPFQRRKEPSILIEALQNFCCDLIDYVAFGHFAVYGSIVNTIERACSIRQKQNLNRSISWFQQSTMVALKFNDQYQQKADLSKLDFDLSTVAENIADRVEREGKLIKAYQLANNVIIRG